MMTKMIFNMEKEKIESIPSVNILDINEAQEFLNKNKGAECYITEKLEGDYVCVFTIYNKETKTAEVAILTKDGLLDMSEDSIILQTVNELYLINSIEALSIELEGSVAVQMVLIGPEIRGNRYNLQKTELRVFNLFDLQNKINCPFFLMQAICAGWNLLVCPGIKVIDSYEFTLLDDSEEIKKLAKVKSRINPEADAYGIVIRDLNNTFGIKIEN
jgi:hypothetical protein